ncbi:hypothetical protein E2542_SST12375 [Spatholobus suberectus]|nr:hypothetical protein E2542_SST12375 [Spatholobus suberectus]
MALGTFLCPNQVPPSLEMPHSKHVNSFTSSTMNPRSPSSIRSKSNQHQGSWSSTTITNDRTKHQKLLTLPSTFTKMLWLARPCVGGGAKGSQFYFLLDELLMMCGFTGKAK